MGKTFEDDASNFMEGRERLGTSPTTFYIKGGTWLMPSREGKRYGEYQDLIGDKKIRKLEEEVDFNQQRLAEAIDKGIRLSASNPWPIQDVLSWVEGAKFSSGEMAIPLLACDSSQRRPAVAAPLIAYAFEQMVRAPGTRQISAIGTDTGCFYTAQEDVFLFDSQTVASGTTGAKRPHQVSKPDAPRHFRNLINTPHKNLPSGSYWHWNEVICPGSDVLKVDPAEEPQPLNERETFFSPHNTAFTADRVPTTAFLSHYHVPEGHVIRQTDWLSLFTAMNSVVTVDLGLDNSPELNVDLILNPKHKAVVVAGFGLGNAYDLVRNAAVEAVKWGKLVAVTSTCLVPSLSGSYPEVALLGLNETILQKEGAQVLDGRKLSKFSLKALLTRALLENCDQLQTQVLINRYAKARNLF